MALRTASGLIRRFFRRLPPRVSSSQRRGFAPLISARSFFGRRLLEERADPVDPVAGSMGVPSRCKSSACSYLVQVRAV